MLVFFSRLWNLDLTVKQYLEIEKARTSRCATVRLQKWGSHEASDLGELCLEFVTGNGETGCFGYPSDWRNTQLVVAGVAAFFGASTACAAFVNRVSDGIAQQLADFGSDLGLVARAAARLECLEESKEKEALLTLVRGVACLHLMDDGHVSGPDDLGPNEADFEPTDPERSRIFDMKVANLRLRAQLQRVHSSEQRSKNRLESIQAIASGDDETTSSSSKRTPKGLGLEFDSEEAREVAQSTKLKKAITEVFSSGGKRLRPALCLLVHDMLKSVIVLATSIEIIHTASLVHDAGTGDDILDDADQRRQQQTMHQIFGPDVAVLSGDFLFAHVPWKRGKLVSLVIEEFGYGDLALQR
eukprot:Skav200676  [mRNA]  locus=scaffold1446:32474:53783:+ [translate_table: standard]